MYPQRGNAERYQGEMHAACSLLLLSSPRPKSHYHNNPVKREEDTGVEGKEDQGQPDADKRTQDPSTAKGKENKKYAEIRPENIARLLIFLLVYQLLHIARRTLQGASSEDVSPAKESRPDSLKAASNESVRVATIIREIDIADRTAVEEEAEGRELQIRTFRLEVLKVGATLTRHGRYVTFYIAHTAIAAWERFWTHFEPFHWTALPDL